MYDVKSHPAVEGVRHYKKLGISENNKEEKVSVKVSYKKQQG